MCMHHTLFCMLFAACVGLVCTHSLYPAMAMRSRIIAAKHCILDKMAGSMKFSATPYKSAFYRKMYYIVALHTVHH